MADHAEVLTLREFLESVPPGTKKAVSDINVSRRPSDGWRLNTPTIRLHCDSTECGGERHFAEAHGDLEGLFSGARDLFLTYVCRNCNRSFKTYALRLARPFALEAGTHGTAMKYGEQPPFGPPIPSGLNRLLTTEDRELFVSGRRIEAQGLGLGAITYYRRVVEDQWRRLLGEIIKVAEKLEAPAAQLEALHAAQGEKRFAKAVELAKPAIPPSLLIDGHHNPLTLLHAAYSEDIHRGTEERCLELAASVRVVLFDLAARLQVALRDDKELRSAVSLLLDRGKEKPAPVAHDSGTTDGETDATEPTPG